jgi:hypothetical protein
MRKYLSYDIELYDDFPEDGNVNFATLTPSVGAFTTIESVDAVRFYYSSPYMSKDESKKLVADMWDLCQDGYTLFGWNTLSFDLQLLALYSGEIEKCSRLAINHVDGMFLVVAHRGYFLGLDKALLGAGIGGKLHQVVLNDKTVFAEMDGSKAPEMWKKGEFDAVMQYLTYDVIQPLKLAYEIEKTGEIKWLSNTGKPQKLKTEMLTVKDALKLPVPNTSWMTDPKPRSEFYNWIPKEILVDEGVVVQNTSSPDLDALDDVDKIFS